MPDLQKTVRQVEERLGELSREILRIEAHVRRGEQRAALARIRGARHQLSTFQGDRETAMQVALVGAQMGLLSGGDWLKGRLPAALIGGLGGWLYGQSITSNQRAELQELEEHLDYLEELASSEASRPGRETQ